MNHTAGIAAGHPLTADAGAEVLRAGGNAFDAAIAAIACACVCEPVLASLGGGGFLTAMTADGEARNYDFFVQTPRRRSDDGERVEAVEVDFGDATQVFHIGAGTSATPGLVRGLFEAHRDLGRMPLVDLFSMAIEHAREGVALSDYQAYLLGVVRPIYTATPSARALFCDDPEDSRLRAAGDTLHFERAADLLESLAIEGDDLFYRGEVAASMVEQCVSEGGHLRRDDLQAYAVVRRAPLTTDYRDSRLFTNPPPSSGGTLIAFALDLLRDALTGTEAYGSADHALTLALAMQLTGRARLQAGASGIEALLDPTLLARYRADCAQRSRALRGTTHVSVIDREGNHAALTVSNGEGNGSIVPGAGFMLNNMLGEEDINPDGIGSWQTNERMTSMMSPSILVDRVSRRSWALGSGGSNRIRSAILQVVSNLADFGLDVETAVAAPRIHVEGDHLSVEAGIADAALERLQQQFPDLHRWAQQNMFFGGVHTVQRDPDESVLGAADTRRGGSFIAL